MKRRLLFVTARPPFPPTGGDVLRSWNVAKQLTADFDVDLVTLAVDGSEQIDVQSLRGVFDTVHIYRLTRARSFCRTALGMWSGKPLQMSYFMSAEARDKVTELGGRAHAVIAHLGRTAPLVTGVPSSRVILDMTDAQSASYRKGASAARGFFMRAVFKEEAKRLSRWEAEAVASFARTVVVAERDATVLKVSAPRSAERVAVIGNGVDSKGVVLPADRKDPWIAFVANFAAEANISAADWIARDLLPALRRLAPNVAVRLVGVGSDSVIRNIAAGGGLEATGRVPEVQPAIADALCGIAPMRMAGGLQNKVLEYLSCGLPSLVSVPVWEGLPDALRAHAVCCHSSDDYAREIVKLLNRSVADEALARAAASAAAAKQSWDAVGESWRDLVSKVADTTTKMS